MIKKFLYTLLRFSILPLLGLVLLELTIAVRKKKLLSGERLEKVFQDSANAYQWVGKVKHNKKILLLGSSSVKYGLNCDLLNELSHDSLAFINLAANARDPVETYFILKQIDLAHVKAVYFGIDPWIYTNAYYRNRNAYLYLDMDIMTAARFSLEHDQRFFPKRYKALIGSLFPTPTSAGKNETIPVGFGTAVLNKAPSNFKDPVHKKFQLEKYGWSDLQFEYLQKILLLCRSKNISFTAFYPPRRSDFIADYDKNCKRIQASFLEKLKAVGFSSPVIGSHDQLKAYGDSLFADAYHLNGKGQLFFSEIFYHQDH